MDRQWSEKTPRFDGDDYVPPRDDVRLTGQLQRIFDLISDGKWRSLALIAAQTGDPEASISAQLRHLRKARFGAYVVERRHLGRGLYEYRLLLPHQGNGSTVAGGGSNSKRDGTPNGSGRTSCSSCDAMREEIRILRGEIRTLERKLEQQELPF